MLDKFKFWVPPRITIAELKEGNVNRCAGSYPLTAADKLNLIGLNIKQGLDWTINPFGDLVLENVPHHTLSGDREFFKGEPVRLHTKRTGEYDYVTFRTQS